MLYIFSNVFQFTSLQIKIMAKNIGTLMKPFLLTFLGFFFLLLMIKSKCMVLMTKGLHF
jgi:hypothetical protein